MSFKELAFKPPLVCTGLTSTLAALVVLCTAQPPARAIDCNDQAAIREYLMRNSQAGSAFDQERLECSATAISPLITIIETEADRSLQLGAMAALGRIGFQLQLDESPTSTQAQKDIVLDHVTNSDLDLASDDLLPLYLEMLRSGESVSTELIEAIAAFGPAASEAIPDLVRLLDTSEDLFLRRSIIHIVPRFGRAAATEGIPILAEILQTAPEVNLREAAAMALGQIASDGINPQLVNLNEEERDIAETILSALTGDSFPLPEDPPIAENLDLPNLDIAIAALFRAFEYDPEATVTLAAARSLGAIGVSNPTFVAALLTRAEAALTTVNDSEASAPPLDAVDVIRLEPTEAGFISVLEDLFRKSQDSRLLGANEDESNDTLIRLIRLVEQGNCQAVFSLEAAVKLASSPSTAVAEALVGAVNRNLCPEQGLMLVLSEIEITSETTSVLSVLIDLAAQRDFDAIFALGSIGPDAEVAVPTLLQVAQTSTDWTSRSGAIHALGRIGTTNPAAIRFLQENLQDPNATDTHGVSALSLGLIGAPAKNTLPTLVERLESLAAQSGDTDVDRYIPQHTANAIARIIQDILNLSPELPQDERAQLGQYIERSLIAIDTLPPEFARLKAPLQEVLDVTSS